MRYVERTEGPGAHPPRLGIVGVMAAAEKGVVVNQAAFECYVDDFIGGREDAWGVCMIVTPLEENGLPGVERTMVMMGREGRHPFDSFESALAFCGAFGRSLWGKNVEADWMEATISNRGMSGVQWSEQASGPEEQPVDDSDGGTCDVTVGVDVPPWRVLH